MVTGRNWRPIAAPPGPVAEPLKVKVIPLSDAAAKEYSTSNAGWPKRTEPCDKAS